MTEPRQDTAPEPKVVPLCDYGFAFCSHPIDAPDVCPNYYAMLASGGATNTQEMMAHD